MIFGAVFCEIQESVDHLAVLFTCHFIDIRIFFFFDEVTLMFYDVTRNASNFFQSYWNYVISNC